MNDIETYIPDMTTTLGKLRHLRHVVENIPPERFNIDIMMEDTQCGSVGCLLGWAAKDRMFNKIGLRLKPSTMMPNWHFVDPGIHEYYDEMAAEIFGIDLDESRWMFTEDRHEGEPDGDAFNIAHGLARIDAIIENYSA